MPIYALTVFLAIFRVLSKLNNQHILTNNLTQDFGKINYRRRVPTKNNLGFHKAGIVARVSNPPLPRRWENLRRLSRCLRLSRLVSKQNPKEK